jgi:hypothetical protein
MSPAARMLLAMGALVAAATVVLLSLGCDVGQALLFELPVVSCSLLVRLSLLSGSSRSIPRILSLGAVAGLLGALVYLAGWLIWELTWYAVKNMNHCEMCGLSAIVIGVVLAMAMAFGAALTLALSPGQSPHAQ